MCLRFALSITLSFLLAVQAAADEPAAPAPIAAAPLTSEQPISRAFLHDTGRSAAGGWMARYRYDRPGYLLRAQRHAEPLGDGAYAYSVQLHLLNGSAGGLFARSNDVIRLEAWDVTTRERLVARTLQLADFPSNTKNTVEKTIVFSTQGRENHLFEPRLFWPGLSSVMISAVRVRRLPLSSGFELETKADVLEQKMGERYLNKGFVLSRRGDGSFDDYGDSAIWTGLYAAAEAWRFQATHDRDALKRMEKSLWALHELQARAAPPGTLVRYPEIRPGAEYSASRDTYMGFFFALAQTLPVIRDRKLKKKLLQDAQAIGDHFLDNDFTFHPKTGDPLPLNPYPSQEQLSQGIDMVMSSSDSRLQLLALLEGLRLYLMASRQKTWPELGQMAAAVRTNRPRDVEALFFPSWQAAAQALTRIRQTMRGAGEDVMPLLVADTSYGKLRALMERVLTSLENVTDGRPITKLEDVKVMSSQALISLHLLKVLGESLPQPNRFEDAYRANLWQEKALLKTLVAWDNVDDLFMESIFGHTGAAVRRSPTQHISYLALYDLISLERDPSVNLYYRMLFDEQFSAMQEDGNAMLHVMRGCLGMGPEQVGVGVWSLSQYSADRRGRGDAYWQEHHRELASRYGEAVDQAADPVDLADRQRDTFIWQRSARSIKGDDSDKWYPPLDYLFVYWLARAHGLLE